MLKKPLPYQREWAEAVGAEEGHAPPPRRRGGAGPPKAPASLGHNRWPCDKGITWFGYSVRAANP